MWIWILSVSISLRSEISSWRNVIPSLLWPQMKDPAANDDRLKWPFHQHIDGYHRGVAAWGNGSKAVAFLIRTIDAAQDALGAFFVLTRVAETEPRPSEPRKGGRVNWFKKAGWAKPRKAGGGSGVLGFPPPREGWKNRAFPQFQKRKPTSNSAQSYP